MGDCPVDEVLNITGFNMNDALDVDPAFFNNNHHMHHHNDDIPIRLSMSPNVLSIPIKVKLYIR